MLSEYINIHGPERDKHDFKKGKDVNWFKAVSDVYRGRRIQLNCIVESLTGPIAYNVQIERKGRYAYRLFKKKCEGEKIGNK